MAPSAPVRPGAWPPLPATVAQIPPFLGAAARRITTRRPPARQAVTHRPSAIRRRAASPPGQSRGLLELVISWRALNGDPAGPATLSRIGPITGGQARLLALTAAADPHARWQVILTDPDGYAIATETIRRRHRRGRARRPAGVTGQVTVTIPAAALDQLADTQPPARHPGTRPAPRHRRQQRDRDPGRGAARRPPRPGPRPAAGRRRRRRARRLRPHHRHPRLPAHHQDPRPRHRPRPDLPPPPLPPARPPRRPRPHHPLATRADRTCDCNLGGYCRTHHQIKQLPGWTLTQPKPGHFQLTTPAGRTYTTTPDPYPD